MPPQARSLFKNRLALLATATTLFAGAGGAGCSADPAPAQEVESHQAAVTGTNGLFFNGLFFNGLFFNGLFFNGLFFNGLFFNGLATNADFSNWFNNADSGDTTGHANVMKYIAKCSLRADQSLTFKDKNNVVYNWPGAVGLAPSWALGTGTEAQNKLVTACVMAHVNTAYPAPKHIQISLRGDDPALATSAPEVATLTTPDGAFFGDMFSSSTTARRYICRATESMPSNYVQTLLSDWGRQCYFTNDGCGGIFTVVDCDTVCTKPPIGSSYNWSSCTVDGKTYPAINVFVPTFKRAGQLGLIGGAALSGSCTHCLENRAITNLAATTNGVKITGWPASSGNYVLDVRYANGATSNGVPVTAYLTVQVNGVSVLDGTSSRWSFPPSGGADTWATKSIPLTLPANATITIKGAGTTAPSIDSVTLRFP